MASAIAGIEVATKIILYYFHERVWAAISWGHRHKQTTTTDRKED